MPIKLKDNSVYLTDEDLTQIGILHMTGEAPEDMPLAEIIIKFHDQFNWKGMKPRKKQDNPGG